jgi:threonine dehydratase
LSLVDAERRRGWAEYARLKGKTWISPYNDPKVIQGAATIADEIIAQANLESAVWLVPALGGGLISE